MTCPPGWQPVRKPPRPATVVDRTRYWIRFPNGTETEFVDGISARDGHRVANIWGFLDGDEGASLAQINLTTDGLIYRQATGAFWRAYKRYGASTFVYMSWLAWFVLLCVIGPNDESTQTANGYFYLLLFGFPVTLWIVRAVRDAKYQADIRQVVHTKARRVREDAQAPRLAKASTAA